MSRQYLIIGNGPAGVSAAEAIREVDGSGRITILTAEPYNMYSRPGLAYVLTGAIPAEQTVARSTQWYETRDIQLRVGTVVQVHPATQHVVLANGEHLAYDRLLIATGARATPAPYPGATFKGVCYLDTMDDTKAILRQARRRQPAVVVGGGITAMELCEGLAAQGMRVHYLLRRERLWDRVFNEHESAVLAEKMTEHGITLHPRSEIHTIQGNWRAQVRSVQLNNGQTLPCRLLGVAIGVHPQLNFLAGSPVEMDRGILVDNHLRSNIPNIFAAGDVAQVYDRWTDSYNLDILWPSAVAEGRVAGLNMAGIIKTYQKEAPFNVCLLFGLHITAIGQVNPKIAPEETIQHLSRGSSEVWFSFPRHYRSAWSEDGDSSLRLVTDENRLVGALLIGERSFADILRGLIREEVDIRLVLPHLNRSRDHLIQILTQVWQAHEKRQKKLGS